MPKAVSKKQWRFMQAILHSKKPVNHPRGTPPKSIASKYSSPGSNAPEQSGQNRGGTWGEKHHKKAKQKEESKKKKLKKSFEEFYKGQGAGVVVVDKEGKILIGKDKLGRYCTPGGHVDSGESFEEAALRELREETGLVGKKIEEIGSGRHEGNDNKSFVVHSFRGKLGNGADGELKQLKFMEPVNIPFDKMRGCCLDSLKQFFSKKLSKSNHLKDMLVMEQLNKNIIRNQNPETVYEVSHGEALRLVGNGAFRILREAVRGMGEEEFKDVKIDHYTLSIRKHVNDVYSGRIADGHKVVHQFTNRTLPQLTAELMSVFEWYLPEDSEEVEVLEDVDLADDAIEGGLSQLISDYKKNNIADIYQEMENIREEVRHGAAVDLQQVEMRIMKLFDKLEKYIHEITEKHNNLTEQADEEIDKIEAKLLELQTKIDELSKKPVKVEAYSASPGNPHKVIDDEYFYLSRPRIDISPSGKISIIFSDDWNHMDRENLLRDMKAKVIKKSRQ